MASFAFTSSNLSTLAMEHMAPIAGTASSVQGVVGTIGAAVIGFVIGQQFDGTRDPVRRRHRAVRGRRLPAHRADRAEAAVRADAADPTSGSGRESTAFPRTSAEDASNEGSGRRPDAVRPPLGS